MAEETKEEVTTSADETAAGETESGQTLAQSQAAGVDAQAGNAAGTEAGKRGRRVGEDRRRGVGQDGEDLRGAR